MLSNYNLKSPFEFIAFYEPTGWSVQVQILADKKRHRPSRSFVFDLPRRACQWYAVSLAGFSHLEASKDDFQAATQR